MEQKVDLDALEAAHKKATPGEWWADKTTVRTHDGMPIAFSAGTTGIPHGEKSASQFIALAHNALPALIAELRQLRARTTPEPIGDKHKDGNSWLMWEPGYEQWLKLRWRYEGWRYGGGQLLGTPTHALPMPVEPEAQ